MNSYLLLQGDYAIHVGVAWLATTWTKFRHPENGNNRSLRNVGTNSHITRFNILYINSVEKRNCFILTGQPTNQVSNCKLKLNNFQDWLLEVNIRTHVVSSSGVVWKRPNLEVNRLILSGAKLTNSWNFLSPHFLCRSASLNRKKL
jgi:hypothetical protein